MQQDGVRGRCHWRVWQEDHTGKERSMAGPSADDLWVARLGMSLLASFMELEAWKS